MIEVKNIKNSGVEVAFAVNNINGISSSVNNNFMKEWEPYCGRCPKCGSTHIEFQTGIMLTSNPPQLNLRCVDCGNRFFSGQLENDWSNKDSLEDMIMPQIRDPLPGEAPYIGDPLPGTPNPWNPVEPAPIKQYGWICPKCGRVLTPHMDTCKFCNGGNLSTATPNTLNDYLSKSINDSNSVTAIPNPNTKLTCDADMMNYITTTNSEMNEVNKATITISSVNSDGATPKNPPNDEMMQKFLNESESVFEAIDKYQEWERNNNNNDSN